MSSSQPPSQPSIFDIKPNYIPSASETPQFAKRISVEQYEAQRLDYTQQALAELHRQMEAAKHFKKMQTERERLEKDESASFKSPKRVAKKVFTPVKKLLKRSSSKSATKRHRKQAKLDELKELKDQVRSLTEKVSKIECGEEFYDPENDENMCINRRNIAAASPMRMRRMTPMKAPPLNGAPPMAPPMRVGAPPPPPPPLPAFDFAPKELVIRKVAKNASQQSGAFSLQNDLHAELKRKLEERKKKQAEGALREKQDVKVDAPQAKEAPAVQLKKATAIEAPKVPLVDEKPSLANILQQRKAALQNRLPSTAQSAMPVPAPAKEVKAPVIEKPAEVQKEIPTTTVKEIEKSPVTIQEKTTTPAPKEKEIVTSKPVPAPITQSAPAPVAQEKPQLKDNTKTVPSTTTPTFVPPANVPIFSMGGFAALHNISIPSFASFGSVNVAAIQASINATSTATSTPQVSTPKPSSSNIPPPPPLPSAQQLATPKTIPSAASPRCMRASTLSEVSSPKPMAASPRKQSMDSPLQSPTKGFSFSEITTFKRSSLKPVTPNMKSPLRAAGMDVDTGRFSLQDALRKKFQSLTFSPDSDDETAGFSDSDDF